MLGIISSNYACEIIKETGCFVANIVSNDLKEVLEYIEGHSGKDKDKLLEMNVHVVESLKVNAPILSDCPVNIECRVVDSFVVGSHEMFIGMIEYVHAQEDLLDNEGKIDYTRISLL